jgi:hypothetical protein
MEVITLSSTNFLGLTSKYAPDTSISFNQNMLYTEQGINLPLTKALNNLNDNRTNNYSSLFLTNKSVLSTNIQIDQLSKIEDEGFSTYLAVNAFAQITPTTRFWVTEEPDIAQNVASVAVSGTYTEIDNRYFFDIVFLTDTLCKIGHEFEGVARYLTFDAAGNLSLAKDAGLDILGTYSPQIFNYTYDRANDFIVFLKNVNDIIQYLSFSPANQELTLVPTITASQLPYGINSIFKCITRNEAPNTTKLFDPWVSYKKNLKTNTQEINPGFSYVNIESNLLLNNQYAMLSGTSFDVNALSLKNTNTSENYQSRNNPFFNENRTEFRDYKKLFTGSNQLHGNDNISVGYEAYTSKIELKKDKVTYFHVPQVFYPFERLNINDSGLTEAGAIAGDHPLKSDKIFKKKADFKNTSNYGDTIEETAGNFLCAWLSGSIDPLVKPIWMDRYYNPKKISFFAALTASEFQAIKYTTIFDCLVSRVADLLGDVDVFDKPSDLIFEKGTYYAYHHYGPNDVNRYLNSLNPILVLSGLPQFYYIDGSNATDQIIADNEYTFTGNTYAFTNSLSTINDTNQFTICFDAHNNDWNTPFAYQLIGNYGSDGFGIFNENAVTPTLLIPTNDVLNITNTNFVTLNNVEFDSSVTGIIKREGFLDYHLIFADGSIRRFNNLNVETSKTPAGVITAVQDIDYTDTTTFVLNKTSPSTKALVSYTYDTGAYLDITSQELSLGRFRFTSNISTIGEATTLDYSNGLYHFTEGSQSFRIDETIFYLNNNAIYKWDNINSSSTISVAFSSTIINAFNIDLDNNIWILFNDNKFAKFTSNRNLILSGVLPSDSYKNYKVDAVSEFITGSQSDKYCIITVQSPTSNNILKYYKINNTTGAYTSASTSFVSSTAAPWLLTNADYLRKIIKTIYPATNLNVKAGLVNLYNSTDRTTTEIIFNLSALDPGYHHFAVRFDSYLGYMYLIIDGQQQGMSTFAPRKYRFSNLISRPFFIGASIYSSTIPLFEYLRTTGYLAEGITIKNFNLYNKPLNYFDINFLAKQGMQIRDIEFDLACGRRNYVEEIERYFKFNIPGSKSAIYNIILRNSGINDKELQYAIEQRILLQLQKLSPAYTRVNEIKWSN